MPLDITFFGVQMPTLLPIFVIASIVQIGLDRIMSNLGWYAYIWHAGLFRTALFVCLFAFSSLIIYH